MPVSPQDFALWASATGRKYPQTAGERAQLTPEVFNFVRNLPKTGLPGGAGEVVERVVYDHPVAVRHEDDNSVFNAPINPDNHVPKVAGTVGNTMTSDHYEAQLAENQEDKADSTNFARTAAKLALAAGVVAGGIAAARSPVVRSRVSEFLSQFGTPREGVVDMVAASGDITPQTTAQNYDQEVIAPQTQIQQAARGAAPGTPLKAMDPTTTESVRVKPVTESEIITTTQSFAPVADPWTGEKTILQGTRETPLSERVQRFTSQFAETPDVDPWASRSELARAQAEADIASRIESRAARGLSTGPSRIERTRPIRSSVYEALAEVAPADIEIDPLRETTVLNIGPQAEISKAASGTGIRGISRIAEVPEAIERRRQISGPDVFVNAPIEMSQDIPGRERQVPAPLERLDPYAERTSKGAGLGIYGPEKAYAAGAISRETGEYTEAATRRPTEVPKFVEARERTPFSGVSSEAIQSMLETGKISSKGQMAAAQQELKSRAQELESRARKIESLKLAQRVLRGEVTIPPAQGPKPRYEYETWSK